MKEKDKKDSVTSEQEVLTANLNYYNALAAEATSHTYSCRTSLRAHLMALKIFVYRRVYLKCLSTLVSRIQELKEKSVLNVGCGADPCMEWFSKDFAAVIGVDVSLNMLKLCQIKVKNIQGGLVGADVMHLPFRDNSFDVVSTFQALHHFPDTDRAINEMVRVSKCIFLYEPNEWSIFHRVINYLQARTNPSQRLVEFHSKGFSFEKISSCMKRAGVKVVNVTPHGLMPASGLIGVLISRFSLLVYLFSRFEDLFQQIPFICWQLSDIVVVGRKRHSLF